MAEELDRLLNAFSSYGITRSAFSARFKPRGKTENLPGIPPGGFPTEAGAPGRALDFRSAQALELARTEPLSKGPDHDDRRTACRPRP